jgi:hypothetical protein
LTVWWKIMAAMNDRTLLISTAIRFGFGQDTTNTAA